MRQKRVRNIILYILIVLIPSIIGIYYYIHTKYSELAKDNLVETQKVVDVHINHIEQFVSQTITSLEILSLVFSTGNDLLLNEDYIDDLLLKMHYKDPRFYGLYIVDIDGKVISGTRKISSKQMEFYQKYFQNTLETKAPMVSDTYYSEQTEQFIVTITSPIFSQNDKVAAYIVADLRLDYIENLIRLINPDLSLTIYDMNHTLIAQTHKSDKATSENHIITRYLKNVPWIVEAQPLPINYFQLLSNSFVYILLVLVVTHIIFLLIQYVLLKRQTAFERIQNDAQKLELVSTLAASTAHEIRNPLTGIKGFIQLLTEKYRDDESQLYFSVIQKEIKRINQIVSELLMLGKPTIQKFDYVDLDEVIKELSPIIDSQANLYNVVYQAVIDTSPLIIYGSKDHIKQLILNLTKNALEAMPLGGALTVSVTKESEHYKIEISDTGKGIPKEALSKIFNPFFTMKETGTGLGLVVCKRIVEMHKGTIEIQSKVNEGTIISIYLPIPKQAM